jgi:hypothetical protein
MREKQNVDGIHGSIRASRWSNDHKCDLKPFDDTESYTEKKPVSPRCGHLLRLVLRETVRPRRRVGGKDGATKG